VTTLAGVSPRRVVGRLEDWFGPVDAAALRAHYRALVAGHGMVSRALGVSSDRVGVMLAGSFSGRYSEHADHIQVASWVAAGLAAWHAGAPRLDVPKYVLEAHLLMVHETIHGCGRPFRVLTTLLEEVITELAARVVVAAQLGLDPVDVGVGSGYDGEIDLVVGLIDASRPEAFRAAAAQALVEKTVESGTLTVEEFAARAAARIGVTARRQSAAAVPQTTAQCAGRATSAGPVVLVPRDLPRQPSWPVVVYQVVDGRVRYWSPQRVLGLGLGAITLEWGALLEQQLLLAGFEVVHAALGDWTYLTDVLVRPIDRSGA
jgi:hypothetical protein